MTNDVFLFWKVTKATELIMKHGYSIAVSLVTYVIIQIFSVENCVYLV
jgi:hypothetical protein